MTEKLHRKMGLSDEEYALIQELMGREPNELELGMFSVMWSEHCSYKCSKKMLQCLPTEGPHILLGPGENAGIVDIGDGLAVAFKMESHNHPSAIEPYQGAATGVGGIIRDIFTMGARPVALLDSLRFGTLDDPRVRYLFEGVVSGISGYGNCVGIPTVGGETFFYPSYQGNPLVNVMCAGILPASRITRGKAAGPGNTVILVGARTGRDGLHGVTFASEELDETSEEQRPAVQVGDPFMEKLLIEACLEAIENDLVTGIQDLGGAGLTCATSEMSSRAGTGMIVHLDRVPCREGDMSPYEMMLSESQERMLLVVENEKVQAVQAIFTRWGLEFSTIGHVTDDRLLHLYFHGDKVGELTADFLCEHAPVYDMPFQEPSYYRELKSHDLRTVPEPDDLENAFLALLTSPNIASKRWIYQQYDYMVRTCTAQGPGGEAAVIRIRGTSKGLAFSADGNGRYVYLDPFKGGMLAVMEAARNVAVTGAKPLAITNCLNFGNPTRPQVYWQFKHAVEGMAEACRILGTPVTGGNVSFYNETSGDAVFPTPVVGMLGLLNDVSCQVKKGWSQEGDRVYLVGEPGGSLAGSEYLYALHGLLAGEIPDPDLARAARLNQWLVDVIGDNLITSAQDISDGGLLIALAEASVTGNRGVEIELPLKEGLRIDELLFGEAPSRVLLSVRPENEHKLLEKSRLAHLPSSLLGEVKGDTLTLKDKEGRMLFEMPLKTIKDSWEEVIPRCLG